MNLSESFKNRLKTLAGLNESFTVQQFVVTVKHDKGKVRIKTTASSADAAKSIVCKAEGCPESAIVSVEKV